MDKYLFDIKPEQVILAAGKTGGILENINNPLSLMLENLEIQTNVLHASMKHKVDRLLFFGSILALSFKFNGIVKRRNVIYWQTRNIKSFICCSKIKWYNYVYAYNLSMNKNMFLPIIPNSIYG